MGFQHLGYDAADGICTLTLNRPDQLNAVTSTTIAELLEAYTGRVFGAEEALAAGLVSRVVPPEQLLPTARELALEIARNTSAVSVALARQLLWKLLGADHPMEAHRLNSQGMFWTGRSADAYEGVTAFVEKRPARFTLKPSVDMPPFYPWWERRS